MVMKRVSAIAYMVIEYVVKTVAPKMLFRLNSTVPAMSCAVAPKKSTQGIISDFAVGGTRSRSVDARTSAATARPISPSGAGSASGTEGDVVLVSVFFSVIFLPDFFRISCFITNTLSLVLV